MRKMDFTFNRFAKHRATYNPISRLHPGFLSRRCYVRPIITADQGDVCFAAFTRDIYAHRPGQARENALVVERPDLSSIERLGSNGGMHEECPRGSKNDGESDRSRRDSLQRYESHSRRRRRRHRRYDSSLREVITGLSSCRMKNQRFFYS